MSERLKAVFSRKRQQVSFDTISNKIGTNKTLLVDKNITPIKTPLHHLAFDDIFSCESVTYTLCTSVCHIGHL